MPQSVGGVLMAAAHEVIFLRHELAPNSPDPLVAAVAEMNGAVLVSLDSDFQTLAPRAGVGRRRFRYLSRIALKCNEPQAAGRMTACLSLIQHEWDFAQQQPDKRIIIEIGNSWIRLVR